MSVIHYMYGSKRRYLRYLMFSLGNSPRVSVPCVARSADSYRFRAHAVKCTYCLHEVRIPLSKSSLIQLTSIGSGKYFCEEGAASAKSKSRIDYYFLERRMSREHSEGRKEDVENRKDIAEAYRDLRRDRYTRILTALPRSESGGIISRDANKRSAADACELMHVTSFSHLLFRAVHARKWLYPRCHRGGK